VKVALRGHGCVIWDGVVISSAATTTTTPTTARHLQPSGAN